MTPQSEATLELELVKQLQGLDYALVNVKDEASLLENLKLQLEKHNAKELAGTPLTKNEFDKVLNHLNKGSVFDRAKILRDKMNLSRDDESKIYLEFMNIDHWCQNIFQITHQVTQEGSYKNRYDVTILINGLPLVHIELKRRGLELKEAFNQIGRYQKHSFDANYGLFKYVQIFIISNGVNTKYYANNRNLSYKQTFYWADHENNNITQLDEFTKIFLEPCHIAKMIAKYIVLNETDSCLMVLRPYQYYATEAIIERVKNNPKKHGYIWHATGSGKTLTSFKTSQILTQIPKVYKVVFVVDRKDLDYQTIREFNAFSKGSVDGTDNTTHLVRQFKDDSTKLIVTTLQKLNSAITKEHHLDKMESLANLRIVFIFDECHRSQFGDTHKRIKKFFTNHQMFGFTGTPIFVDNANSKDGVKQTTKELFDDCLHKYIVTNAIKDENVLKFSVEYIGRIENRNSHNYIDIDVQDIDKPELLESPKRLTKIVDYIIANHDRKTSNKTYNAIFCVSSIKSLLTYYDLFKQAKQEGKHKLKIATIFSYTANEEDSDANGILDDDINSEKKISPHTRDQLDSCIADYNATYGTKFSTKDNQQFYTYYTDISKRAGKDHAKLPSDARIDILLVVNMFLTGFDSKTLNTIYVDKNLRYHGLMQAYSRTNRILDSQKSQGNVVSFRNLKKATDEAIALFSNKDAKEDIFIRPFEEYIEEFKVDIDKLLAIVPSVDAVNNLTTEHEELTFIKAFRELLRVKNVLSSFADFEFKDFKITPQDFEDYKSKYFDLNDKVKSNTAIEKVSVLNDVDFEMELIHRDDINVDYIIRLLTSLAGDKAPEAQQKRTTEINNLLNGEIQLRSKKSLIEKFINENMPNIQDSHDVPQRFDEFWEEQQRGLFKQLCDDEQLDQEGLATLVDKYKYNNRKPLNEELSKVVKTKLGLLERQPKLERIWNKITTFVDMFSR